MFGRDLEDKRRRIAAAPQDDRQVLGRAPIKGCFEVWLRLLVPRRLAEAPSGIVRTVQRSARALIDRQRGKARGDQARRDGRVLGFARLRLVKQQDDRLGMLGHIGQSRYADTVTGWQHYRSAGSLSRSRGRK